jgi:hypothetical protein
LRLKINILKITIKSGLLIIFPEIKIPPGDGFKTLARDLYDILQQLIFAEESE